jgi:hypothetical protein
MTLSERQINRWFQWLYSDNGDDVVQRQRVRTTLVSGSEREDSKRWEGAVEGSMCKHEAIPAMR